MTWKSRPAADVGSDGVIVESGVPCDVEAVKVRIGTDLEKLTREQVFLLPDQPLRPLRKVPKQAGIYFLTVGSELNYIGSARNLDSRVAKHQSWIRMNPALLVRVRWITFPADDELEMRRTEGALIRSLRPVCNVDGNPASSSVYSCVDTLKREDSKGLHCLKCEHNWTPRVLDRKPVRCPNCQQPKWWEPRRKPRGEKPA